MKRERYEQAARLFDEALALRPAEREAFLANSANVDADLLEQVRQLIEYDQRAERTAELHAASPRMNPFLGTLEEKIVGRYHLIDLIGEGAFGAVYKAEQTDPVRRTVAVKVLKAGMDSQQVLARFDAERQALAMMEHPGIARVIDAGTTDAADGSRPYFVMEFVTGEPITRSCEQANLSLEARLELFCLVCQAVQHAHQRGIIHRDLKPSNILVCEVDGAAVPKVIDFGIAKAIHQPLTAAMTLTNRMELLGTPQYMSPEQADANELAIDTRTDVYSLGVVLYEMLTGSPPLDDQSLQGASYSRMVELIRDHRVERPSTRIAKMQQGADHAQPMTRDRIALARHLRGDLDWILLKALDTDRERRYESPAALAEDLRRYMRNEPVIAGPPSAAYRMRKFVRRHRVGVIATALMTITLVGGVIGTSLGMWRATRAKAKSDMEAAKARQIASFSQLMIAGINPTIARGKDTQLLRIILDDAAANVDRNLSNQPEVEAAIRTTIGSAYLALAQFDLARPQLERALAIRTSILGNDDPETLASLSNLGRLYWIQGKFNEAEPFAQQALDGRRRVLGSDHPDTLRSLNEVANLRWDQGRLAEATAYLREVLEAQRRTLGDQHPDTLRSINNVGAILKDQGKLAEAEPFFREALEGSRAVLGNDHPQTLAAIANMGRLMASQNKLAEAEAFLNQAVNEFRRVMGPEHPDTLTTMNSVAVLMNRQGKLADAEKAYREILDGRRRALGDDNPMTLMSMNNVGSVLVDQNKFAEALPYFDEALERQQRTLGSDHPDTLRSLHNIAIVLEKLGRFREAQTYYQNALDGRRRKFGAESSLTASTMKQLASLLLNADDPDVRNPQRALELALEANVATGEANPEILDVLAAAYHQTGAAELALETQVKAVGALPQDSPLREEFERRRKEYESSVTRRETHVPLESAGTQPSTQ